MKYFTFNSDNYYTGFIDTNDVPLNSTIIEPSSESHILWDLNNESWIIPEIQSFSFDDLVAKKIEDVRDYFDELVLNVEHENGAHFEIATWETQRQEWMEYTKDNNSPTPYCDMLSFVRGIDKTNLMTRIGSNVQAYASIQGTLHKIEDAINLTTTEEELDAITW